MHLEQEYKFDFYLFFAIAKRKMIWALSAPPSARCSVEVQLQMGYVGKFLGNFFHLRPL